MHDHTNHSTDFSFQITEMKVMWALMGLMAAHHVWMWWKMKKGKKCDC
jgi:hypothetical protein